MFVKGNRDTVAQATIWGSLTTCRAVPAVVMLITVVQSVSTAIMAIFVKVSEASAFIPPLHV